eukprot:SM000077S21578  [mRNA]  locus=s77:341745:342244:+ [translate_table: standard]
MQCVQAQMAAVQSRPETQDATYQATAVEQVGSKSWQLEALARLSNERPGSLRLKDTLNVPSDSAPLVEELAKKQVSGKIVYSWKV